MDSNNKSSEESIKREIEKTGLPTEIRVTNLLRTKKWTVFNEYPFLDDEANKIRTLDIRASKAKQKTKHKKKEKPFSAYVELLIECKKSTKDAWVFHVVEVEDTDSSYMDFILNRVGYEVRSFLPQDKKPTCITKIPPIYTQEHLKHKIALSHQVIGGADHLFEAYMQILKALKDRDSETEKITNQIEQRTKEFSDEEIIIPVIVFDGALYECYLENNELKTKSTSFVRSLVNILPFQKMPIMIDVVKLEVLPEYIEMIESEFPQKKAYVNL